MGAHISREDIYDMVKTSKRNESAAKVGSSVVGLDGSSLAVGPHTKEFSSCLKIKNNQTLDLKFSLSSGERNDFTLFGDTLLYFDFKVVNNNDIVNNGGSTIATKVVWKWNSGSTLLADMAGPAGSITTSLKDFHDNWAAISKHCDHISGKNILSDMPLELSTLLITEELSDISNVD